MLFRKLETAQLEDIVRLLLNATVARLAAHDIRITVTDAAVRWIAESGYEPEYGARPLRRLIQREVDDRIAELLVSSELLDGGAVTVDAGADGLAVAATQELPLAA